MMFNSIWCWVSLYGEKMNVENAFISIILRSTLIRCISTSQCPISASEGFVYNFSNSIGILDVRILSSSSRVSTIVFYEALREKAELELRKSSACFFEQHLEVTR